MLHLKLNFVAGQYKDELSTKQAIIVANKMDVPGSELLLQELRERVDLPIFTISALEKHGIGEVAVQLRDMLERQEHEITL